MNDHPPKIHNLLRLAELAELKLNEEEINHLAVMNLFCMEGRYPQSLPVLPDIIEVQDLIIKTEEVLSWLIKQL